MRALGRRLGELWIWFVQGAGEMNRRSNSGVDGDRMIRSGESVVFADVVGVQLCRKANTGVRGSRRRCLLGVGFNWGEEVEKKG